jgi:uncharacterized integral membrane protein
MPYEYRRRRPSLIRNFWVYRYLIASAMLLGIMLWFIVANGDQVTVKFPFALGKLTSSLGIVILMSALVGSLATVLIGTVVLAIRRVRKAQASHDSPNPVDQKDDRPPPDYAAKAADGFPNARWSD